MKDFYQSLNVKDTATGDEIKKAYRKLATENHPDRNKDANAEVKMKEINEAYDTLGDTTKKQQYDQMKKFGGNPPGRSPFGGQQQPGDWTVYSDFGGGAGFEDIFSSIFGSKRRRNKNEDLTAKYNISLEEAFEGVNTDVMIQHQGQPKKIRITIPAGVISGTRLKFGGKGDHSNTRLPPGDLIIQIRIKPHTIFQRNNNNLYCAVDLNVVDAILGVEVDVITIDKKVVRVKIPPGTKHDAILKVSGYGMNVNGKRGILYVQTKLQVPSTITLEQKDLLLKFKSL